MTVGDVASRRSAHERQIGGRDADDDVRTRRASSEGATVELTAREYQVLEFLMRHAGQVISREQLLSHIWGYDFDPGSNVVDVYIRNLRKKLGAERIETTRNMGYRFHIL